MSVNLTSRSISWRCTVISARAIMLCAAVIIGGASPSVSAHEQDFRPGYLDDGLYTEGWDQIFYFPDGTLLVGQFTVTNVSFGDHNAGIMGALYRPNKPPVIIKKSRSKEKWTFAGDRFDFSVLRHRLTGKSPDYQMAIRKASGEIEVEFTAMAPIWRLGRTVEIEDDFQYVSFYAPLAVGRARYRLPKGKKGELGEWLELGEGAGFAVRYINSTATDELFHSTTRIVSVERQGPRPVIYMVRRLDGTWFAHVAIFERNKLLHSSAVPLGADSFVGNERSLKSIALNGGGDTFRLTGTIKINSLLGRLDPVDLLKPYVRVFIRLFNTPVHYRYLAEYELSYTRRGDKARRLVGRAILDRMLHSESENNN